MNFGKAIKALKKGHKIARDSWQASGKWLALSTGNTSMPADEFWNPHAKKFAQGNNGEAEVLSYIILKTTDDKIRMGWTANSEEILAEDWLILED